MTILELSMELSLIDILMIRPQYQKIFRRIVAHLPMHSQRLGKIRVKSIRLLKPSSPPNLTKSATEPNCHATKPGVQRVKSGNGTMKSVLQYVLQ